MDKVPLRVPFQWRKHNALPCWLPYMLENICTLLPAAVLFTQAPPSAWVWPWVDGYMEVYVVSVMMAGLEWFHEMGMPRLCLCNFASNFSFFCLHRPILQPDPDPGGERLDPESQTASQPCCSKEEAGGSEESGSQFTRQHCCVEQCRAATGNSQETVEGSQGCQVGLYTPAWWLLVLIAAFSDNNQFCKFTAFKKASIAKLVLLIIPGWILKQFTKNMERCTYKCSDMYL